MGALPVRTSASSASWIGDVLYTHRSGTGRSARHTSATSAPVRRRRSSAIADVSPSVADMSRKRVCFMVSSGTCHAVPRSESE